MSVCDYPNGKTSRQSQKYRSARKGNLRGRQTTDPGEPCAHRKITGENDSRRKIPRKVRRITRNIVIIKTQNIAGSQSQESSARSGAAAEGAARLHTAALSLSSQRIRNSSQCRWPVSVPARSAQSGRTKLPGKISCFTSKKDSELRREASVLACLGSPAGKDTFRARAAAATAR